MGLHLEKKTLPGVTIAVTVCWHDAEGHPLIIEQADRRVRDRAAGAAGAAGSEVCVATRVTARSVRRGHDAPMVSDPDASAHAESPGEKGVVVVKRSAQIKVFISSRNSVCDECAEELGRKAWITLAGDCALCLACADLDHLVFLPAGDAALTRRSRNHSTLSAVVLKWSGARKRYERQGLLLEEAALEKAEEECLADEEARARQRERGAARRAEVDREYVGRFASRIRALFPGCPTGREVVIAEHACQKYSGRVGRSAAAKNLDEELVRLAVAAHIRHAETGYDELLARSYDRSGARLEVAHAVDEVIVRWRVP